MEFLQCNRLGDGNCECRVAINVLAEENTLCPGLGGEVDLALLHRDLPCRRLARDADLRPYHFHGEKVAGDRQGLLRDSREGERF